MDILDKDVEIKNELIQDHQQVIKDAVDKFQMDVTDVCPKKRKEYNNTKTSYD